MTRSNPRQTDRDKEFVRELTNKSEDFSQWYVDVVRKAGLADYTTIKGCMVIKPYGFALWENMKAALDRRIKDTGHENAYFPLFVPESLLNKEAEHVEGFAPEVAWVTHGGKEPLEERLAIRPTSEAIICSIYAKWIQSYRDLPVLINQWANVVRWEKVTRLFLRTTEFLWQEGHTCHRTREEAQEETLRMLDVYRDFAETELAMPVLTGRKSESEKFAGAEMTYAIEALMADGRALQAGTSHNLGQHFARVFDIKFLDEDNTEKFVYQTSWGVSTRLVGGIIMTHGDDAGLRLPPRVAPVQVVFVPIIFEDSKAQVFEVVERLAAACRDAGIRVKCDLREQYSPGWKYNEWELKGVPLRVEVGPKDLQKNQCVLVRRDNRKKEFLPQDELIPAVKRLLDDVQRSLFEQALAFREANTHHVSDYAEFKDIIENRRGFVYAPWSGDADTEAAIKEETKATIRVIPFEQPSLTGVKDIYDPSRPAKFMAVFARAY
ncbi:MAG: proline--tRNA ligase [Candidatus Sumerlaeia bacterium]